MARYNEILTGRFNRMAQKLLSMKGPASLVTLSDELFAIFPLFNGTENRYLESWDRFFFQMTVAAGGVGNRSAVRMRNPTGSNVVGVMEKITFYNTAAADVPALNQTNVGTDLTSVLSATRSSFDRRGRTNPTVIPSSSGNAGALTGPTIWQNNVPINTGVDVIITDIQEFPLLPGDDITMFSINTNTSISMDWWWRERALEESERF